jgi:hypothetical protein
MSGDMPPLPQYTLMAWCSVKKKQRDSFTFLPLPSLGKNASDTCALLSTVYGGEDVKKCF